MRRWLSIIGCMGFAVVGSARAAPRDSARLLATVEADLARGRSQAAERRLARALLNGSDDASVWLRYAELALPCTPEMPLVAPTADDMRRSTALWSKLADVPAESLDETPPLRRVWLHWALFAALAGDWEASFQRANRAARRHDPETAACLRHIAALAVTSNELARARDALTAAHSYVPEQPAVSAELGLVLLRRGEADLAMEHLAEAFAATPKDLGARRDLAYALAAAGRALEGYELLTREVAACRMDDRCLLELANLAREAGQWNAARDHAAALADRTPDDLETLFLLADSQTHTTDLPAARESYRRILQLSPEHPRAVEALKALESPSHAP